MISSLKVLNYALIDELNISFHKGLNIITGETGAGKSVLLGALSLILGKRADMSALYDKSKKCIIEAEFEISDYSLQHFFEMHELDYEDQTIIRREISPNGKSRSFINDTPVVLSVLESFSAYLIDIHSQHQNLLLNDQQYLLGIIDAISSSTNLQKDYTSLFMEYNNCRLKFDALKERSQKDNQEIDFMKHQLQELQDARLVPDELSSLEEELKQLEHSEEIKEALNQIAAIFDYNDQGLINTLSECERILGKITKFYNPASEYLGRLNPLRIELKELGRDIQESFDKVDLDPEKIEYTRERVSLIYALLLKHKVQENNELIKIKEDLEDRLNNIDNDNFELDRLEQEMGSLKLELGKKADLLSRNRIKSFTSFSQNVRKILEELGIQHAKFEIDRTSTEFTRLGIDKIRFMFTANKNSEIKDITKIASGGELSRLMLAIKYLISNSSGLPTIILDEIDSGVSGEIADKVGNIIGEMSDGIQVINITHLPQVASKGNYHYLVYKTHSNERMHTNIKLLSDKERLREIAKMLSGKELTDAAIANAKVLLGLEQG